LTFKLLVQEIITLAEQVLPLDKARAQDLDAWAGLHGWDISDVDCQQFIARQAVLNALIRQTVPGVAPLAFPTPLDALNISVPRSICDTVRAQSTRTPIFNFWGELYSALIPQAQRRRLGQFWTDPSIAEWMITWLLQAQPRSLVDVGCGAGNFLLQAAQSGNSVTPQLYGCEISPLLLNVTRAAFLTQGNRVSSNMPILIAQNYLDTALPVTADAIICNPPYTRHHHIAPATKDALQRFFKRHLQIDVSRQGTLAFFFLLKLIVEMPEGARGAVIVPMEVLDARYGKVARHILCQHTTLSAIIVFSPQMNAFPKVEVGATILLFTKGKKKENLVRHLTLHAMPTTVQLLECLESTQKHWPFGSLVLQSQSEMMDIPKWFSIAAPAYSNSDEPHRGLVVPLKALARVVRGIATGANDFFILSTEQVRRYALEPFVVRTVHRNREIQDIILDETRWQALADAGKRVWLLYLNNEDVNPYPALCDYLERGKKQGYHHRRLVQTRKQWYLMEQREIPPIFFTILTRGKPRFILNRANVRPVNMFSLIYPNRYILDAEAVEILWVLLNSHFSLARLQSVSRTYGGNTLKVEPRELDNLPVINPLALGEDTRATLKKWIDDFYQHQQTSILMHQVNTLVDELLCASPNLERSSSIPLQLHLLEKPELYHWNQP